MHDSHSKGDADYSVTELIAPPRIRALRRKHEKEIVEDVADNLWRFFGTAVHSVLERHDLSGDAERRLSITLADGTVVSGGMDRFILQSGTLQDYKTTSIYAVKNASTKIEWEEQLNVYAEILRYNKIDVRKLEIVAFARDHRASEIARDPQYPSEVTTIEIDMWEPRMAMAYLEERVRVHKDAVINLPLCTNEERWAQPEVWAVKKKGGGYKAIPGGLFTSQRGAWAYCEANPGHFIEHRPPKFNRCERYCNVNKFCSTYMGEKNGERSF